MATATACTCGAGGGQAKKQLLRRKTTTKKGDRENPYSERGVEKFSALLDEIEEKKRLIYSQLNPDEVSLIRFVHAGDNKLKPLVVRANSMPNKSATSKHKEEEVEVLEDAGDQDREKNKMEVVEAGARNEEDKSLSMEARLKRFVSNRPWIRANYKVGGMVVLVLVMAVVFGRYWKTYYLPQLQATVCPRIQTE